MSPFTNFLYGVSGQTLFTINLSRVNPNVPAGSVANIVTRGLTMPDDGNNIIDIALAPSFYEAENATLGGGATIATNFPGFSGTGYVSLGDSAGSSVEFQVNQNVGLLAFNLTYANGSNVERVCTIEIDGSAFSVVRFPPTGSWTNYSTALALANLGTGPGFHSLRITSTNTGGPNLDRIFFNF